MNLTNIMGAAAQVVANPTPTNSWSTTAFSCEEPGKTEHWLWACFCTPCAAAWAKSKADKSNPVFNFFCFTPIGSYNHVRLSYNIIGDCGTDLLYSWLCMPCGVRQAFTESTHMGQLSGSYGQDSEPWTSPLFSCEAGDCFKATFCPCLIAHDIRITLLPQSTKEAWFNYLCIWPMSMYGQARHHIGVKSEWPHSACEDIFLGCFFYPCALLRAKKDSKLWRDKQTVGVMASGLAGVASGIAGNAMGKLNNLKAGFKV